MQNGDAYKLPTLGSYNEGPLKIRKEGPKREMSMKVSIFKLGYFLSLGENINSRVSSGFHFSVLATEPRFI